MSNIGKGGSPPAHGGAYVQFPSAPADYLSAVSAGSVKRLFDAAIAHAQDRLDWYDRKASQLAGRARWLRLFSIAFFAAGTAMPVVMAMLIKWPNNDAATQTELRTWPFTELGYVLLALAGALVVFDQFFDLSGSWIRYRQAQARLEVQVADLRYSWASLLAECGGVIADGTMAAKFVNLLRDFVVRVELTAEIETKEWATQFRSRIEAFDRNPNLKVRLPGEEATAGKPDSADKAGGADKAPDGQAASSPPASGPVTVKVRLAVADAETIQELKMTLNDHDLPVAADGHVEVPLEVDSIHTIAGRGMRGGKQVQGTLTITPTLDDEGKPLLITLT